MREKLKCFDLGGLEAIIRLASFVFSYDYID